MVWRLPDLTAARPEGHIQAAHISDDRTKEYYWKISSAVDPAIVRPLLETNQQRGFDFVTFTQPPVVAAEIWGRWHERERTGVKGSLDLTNFTFRGQSISALQTEFQYTNRYLLLTDRRARTGDQQASASSLAIDFRESKMYLSNGFGTADPALVTRMISPKVAKIMEPYRFERPPTAHVHGVIPMRREQDADLHFEVA